MSNRFLNDHSVGKVEIFKILELTAGGFHCWVDSNVGRIRKPNNALVKLSCWYEFWNISSPDVEPEVETKIEEIHFGRWWERLWNWILKKVGIKK